MSDLNAFLERLNTVLSWELAGTIQYLHHSTMVTGPWREPMMKFFQEGSEEAREHAQAVANKIVALGGIPTVEPATIRPAASMEAMLEAALQLEKDALAGWLHAYELAEHSNPGTAFWMEEFIAHEQEHVDHLMKLTKEVSPSMSASKDTESEQVG